MQRNVRRNRRPWTIPLIALAIVGLVGITVLSDPIGAMASVTQDVLSRVSDVNTMENYQNELIGGGTQGSSEKMATGSRYAGRIWSDKSVVANPLSGGDATVKLSVANDGVEGEVTSNEDFLTVFSALGSS